MVNTNSSKLIDEISVDSRYRAAFPSFKVFIYGYDISGDVISVSVNQSGGSLERAPSTCSITLANYREKYTLTHKNMIILGSWKAAIEGGVEGEKAAKSASDYLKSYNPSKFGFEYANPYAGQAFNSSSDATYSLSGQVATYLSDLSPEKYNELKVRLATSTDEEVRYLLEAEGITVNSLDDAESIASVIIGSKIDVDNGSLLEFGSKDFVLGELGEDDLNYSIKDEVIRSKILNEENRQFMNPKEASEIVRVVKQQQGLLFNYPFQEGDCIFNLNDPVRVAFRDPFDPRVWYWMFTGFVDTWTEDMGPNLDSVLNITCTDVSKIARYTVSQVRTGLVDANIEKLFDVINDVGSAPDSQIGVRLTKEIFSGLRVSEVLELNFFGADSASKVSVASRFPGLDFSELNTKYYKGTHDKSNTSAEGDPSIDGKDPLGIKVSNEEQLILYLTNLGLSAEQIEETIYKQADVVNSYDEIYSKIKGYLGNGFKETVKSNFGKIKEIGWQAMTSPGDIPFKRSSSRFGVGFYVYGDPDEFDLSLGAIKIDNFWQWNEILHHRVRESDLETMKYSSTAVDVKTQVAWSNPDNLNNSALAKASNFNTEQIVDVIGKDLKNYPVGHGRVFYLSPARLSSFDEEGILSRGFGGVGNFHSVFKDRLSMLYDMAQAIEWRFYATPKGDFVFEHPLYDHDPSEFFKPGLTRSGDSNNSDLTPYEKIETYENVFAQKYSGGYSDAEDLTQLVLELNTDDQDLIDFMNPPEFKYREHFVVGFDEQLSFSNTNSDKGLLTVYRVKPHNIYLLKEGDVDSAQQFVYAVDKSLIPTLGFRLMDGAVEDFVSTYEGGLLLSSLKLKQINSEARNISLETIPKFGLMVNRPLYWRYRNYYANIVSCSHSIAWNNNVATAINLNQVRAWSGLLGQDSEPVFNHFGDQQKSFNWADIMSRAKHTKNRKGGDK